MTTVEIKLQRDNLISKLIADLQTVDIRIAMKVLKKTMRNLQKEKAVAIQPPCILSLNEVNTLLDKAEENARNGIYISENEMDELFDSFKCEQSSLFSLFS